MFTRRKLPGKQLAGAKAFAANPDERRHCVRIFHGCEKCGLETEHHRHQRKCVLYLLSFLDRIRSTPLN